MNAALQLVCLRIVSHRVFPGTANRCRSVSDVPGSKVPYRVALPGAPNHHVIARHLVSCAALGGFGVAESDTTSVGELAEHRVIAGRPVVT